MQLDVVSGELHYVVTMYVIYVVKLFGTNSFDYSSEDTYFKEFKLTQNEMGRRDLGFSNLDVVSHGLIQDFLGECGAPTLQGQKRHGI